MLRNTCFPKEKRQENGTDSKELTAVVKYLGFGRRTILVPKGPLGRSDSKSLRFQIASGLDLKSLAICRQPASVTYCENPLQLRAANLARNLIITSRDANSAHFEGCRTSCNVIVFGVLGASFRAKH